MAESIEIAQELEPDVIITQDLCNVCSVDLNLVRKVCEDMSKRPNIVSLDPFTIEDVLDDITRVGQAVGRSETAEAKVTELRRRIATASAVASEAAARREQPLKVLLPLRPECPPNRKVSVDPTFWRYLQHAVLRKAPALPERSERSELAQQDACSSALCR